MDVGVIGVGSMGKNHARVYSELKAVDNLFLFDLNTSAAQELAKKFDANVASGMDDLLDSVDAVSVCGVPTQSVLSTKALVAEIRTSTRLWVDSL